MLNSLNNNPGDGNQKDVAAGNAPAEEPIIQEVFEEEPDDYNYVPQIQEVDEEEIRNLSAIREETKVDTRVYKVCAGFFLAALIGGGIGMALAGNSASNADLARKSSMSRTLKTMVTDKLEQFEKYADVFSKFTADTKNFDIDEFNDTVATYADYSFMLDMSSEVTAESVILAGDSRANPLVGLRKYSVDTIMLNNLISNHINETKADAEAIQELVAMNGAEMRDQYAVQILPDGVNQLMWSTSRSMYANGAIGLYTYKDMVGGDLEEGPERDAKTAERYISYKNDAKWGNWQKERRDYVPETPRGRNRNAEETALDLPNRMMHIVLDRKGEQKYFFTDEIIIVDRELFFGKSMNALERYELRTRQIQALIDQARADSKSIATDLEAFMNDADKAEFEKIQADKKKEAEKKEKKAGGKAKGDGGDAAADAPKE